MTLLRLARYAPYIALSLLLAGGVWLMRDHREQALAIHSLEADIRARDASIRTLRDEAAAAAEQHQADLAALEEEMVRQTGQTAQYRAALEGLAGLADGEVSPILRRAVDDLP